jgi:hypothetical protein
VDRGIDLLVDNGDEVDASTENTVFQIPCYNDSLVMFSSTSGKILIPEQPDKIPVPEQSSEVCSS